MPSSLMATNVSRLQRRIQDDYASDLGLDPSAAYQSGAPLRPLPPLDAGTGHIMVVGAYPSARFAVVGKHRDVPAGDNMGPFEPERYFDGQRVRTQASADELRTHFFAPLDIQRRLCWVTDLVKVFLFKEGHRAKYRALGAAVPDGYVREQFESLAARSVPWLEREISVAVPKLLITLGSGVAGILHGATSQRSRNALLNRPVSALTVGAHTVMSVHLAHPGILMRGGNRARNPWPERHQQRLVALSEELEALGLRARQER